MNRSYEQPFRHPNRGDADRYDRGRGQAPFRESESSGNQDSGTGPRAHPDRRHRFDSDPYRRPYSDSGHGYSGDRQFGEYENGSQGRFGEGEHALNDSQQNPAYPDGGHPYGYGLGFGEGGRPLQHGSDASRAQDYYRGWYDPSAHEPDAPGDRRSAWRGQGYYSDFSIGDEERNAPPGYRRAP